MTLAEIKQAVINGCIVHWANVGYVVEKNCDYWWIRCTMNDNCVGLTHKDGVTLSGKESEFFIGV